MKGTLTIMIDIMHEYSDCIDIFIEESDYKIYTKKVYVQQEMVMK